MAGSLRPGHLVHIARPHPEGRGTEPALTGYESRVASDPSAAGPRSWAAAHNEPVTAVENALLVWLVIGIGITAGVFIVARAAIQIAEVGYRVLEKRLDPQVATRQTILLTLAMLLAGLAVAVIAAISIAFFLGNLLQDAPLQ